MKVLEHYEVPVEEISQFLLSHVHETLIIKEYDNSKFYIAIEQEYAEPELHMFHLRKFVESGDATLEEQNAAEYAISAIKTLMDMGVIE